MDPRFLLSGGSLRGHQTAEDRKMEVANRGMRAFSDAWNRKGCESYKEGSRETLGKHDSKPPRLEDVALQ